MSAKVADFTVGRLAVAVHTSDCWLDEHQRPIRLCFKHQRTDSGVEFFSLVVLWFAVFVGWLSPRGA